MMSNTAHQNFNPRGPCGPRHLLRSGLPANLAISILAVLADRDTSTTKTNQTGTLISILAVLADRDLVSWSFPWRPVHFNPRGPCGPRHIHLLGLGSGAGISILAVLADRDDVREATFSHIRDISILAVLADRD